jgi:hypothetical protein
MLKCSKAHVAREIIRSLRSLGRFAGLRRGAPIIATLCEREFVKKMTNELASRIKSCPQLKGEFTLRSGKVSDTYFDKYLFESDPELLVAICKEMAKLIPKTTDILAGLELGGIPVVPVLSQVTGLPCAFLRKEAKECGTCKC